MTTNVDLIELIIPFKAEYVSVARLVVSGIATRLGFDIEVIEDIKVAVAEVCNKMVKSGSKTAKSFKVVFQVSERTLTVKFGCEDKSLKCLFDDENDELGISIINALMDQVDFYSEGNYLLSMSKAVEGNI